MSLAVFFFTFGLLCLQTTGFNTPRHYLKPHAWIEYSPHYRSSRISKLWGQYSPYSSPPTDIPNSIPDQCSITCIQILSRHGERHPIAHQEHRLRQTLNKIHNSVPGKSLMGKYQFLADYSYNLEANTLVPWGKQEMARSGRNFFERYRPLTANYTPFIRSTHSPRVVESADQFALGFHQARLAFHGSPDPSYPYPKDVISGDHNTLHHGLCTAFEQGTSKYDIKARDAYFNVFIPPIQQRLDTNLMGAKLSEQDAVRMMDLCPFSTVASSNGASKSYCKR
ncbi:phosphoglycerate mutase-like protein [Viridothelium virens]|uniref:3-phytase n=1 Tax=Viridothelium virens TaxID=1048519 RepID=A0A6A6H8G5_VIRVR|nr:phosphoglycerate mutase-like protein [Viridothelium virens]